MGQMPIITVCMTSAMGPDGENLAKMQQLTPFIVNNGFKVLVIM